jgi:hypothetical protein
MRVDCFGYVSEWTVEIRMDMFLSSVWMTAMGTRSTPATARIECQSRSRISLHRAGHGGRYRMRGMRERNGLLRYRRCRGLDWGQRMARRRQHRTRSPPSPPNCACVSRLSGFLPRGETRVFPPPWDGRIWQGLGRVLSPVGSNRTQNFDWAGILPPSG